MTIKLRNARWLLMALAVLTLAVFTPGLGHAQSGDAMIINSVDQGILRTVDDGGLYGPDINSSELPATPFTARVHQGLVYVDIAGKGTVAIEAHNFTFKSECTAAPNDGEQRTTGGSFGAGNSC